jgi:hypothetical protein
LLGLYSLISLWACDLLNASSAPYAAARICGGLVIVISP